MIMNYQTITTSPEHDTIFEVEENFKPLEAYKGNIIVIADTSDSKKKFSTNFYKKWTKRFGCLFSIESNCDLPKRILFKNNSIILLFQQTLNDVRNTNRDLGGFDMSSKKT